MALALIPLAFNGRDVVIFFLQPKDLLLHLAALSIVGLWGFEWALQQNRPRLEAKARTRLRDWLGWDPRRWALLSAGGFGATAVVSTAMSPLPEVSLWGRDVSTLGYDLYSVLALLIIFFAIALRVREPEQVKRILWVIVGAGVITAVYGTSQRYGWDPIGFGAGDGRVISSFGNPIFFGSYLVMSTVITLGITLVQGGNGDTGRWRLPVIALFVGVQLAALWFTGSRGPWVGVAFGIGTFAILGIVSLGRAQLLRVASAYVSGLLIAVLLVNLAGEPNAGTDRRLGSVVSGAIPVLGGAGGRSDIWQGSARLLNSWERPYEDSAVISGFRPIFGLGPEMYYYSYPLVANPQSGLTVVSHAHSLPLQLLLERGLAGLATFAALACAVLLAGISLIRNHRHSTLHNGNWIPIVSISLVAALIGRAVEQTVGIARIGDLVPFWALLGVVLAVYGITARAEPEPRLESRTGFAYVPLAVATVVAIAAATTYVVRDFQSLRAGLMAGDAFAESRAGNRDEAVTLLQKASDLAPDVQQYRVQAGEMQFLEARAQQNDTDARTLYEEAYETFVGYERRDPSAFITQMRLSNTATELLSLGDDSRLEEVIERTYRAAVSMPAYPAIQGLAAQRLLVAGQLDLGLELANRAISMEAETSPQPLAWLQRGLALGRQGDVEGALSSFVTGLERSPTGSHAPSLHRSAALSYDALGDPELASEHRALAEEIEATLLN